MCETNAFVDIVASEISKSVRHQLFNKYVAIDVDKNYQRFRAKKLIDFINKHHGNIVDLHDFYKKFNNLSLFVTLGGRHQSYKDGRTLLGCTNGNRRQSISYNVWVKK